MKKFRILALLLIILLSCSRSFGQAQKKDSTEHFYRNEVALDMFYFLNILHPNFLPGASTRMNVALEHHLTGETLIRIGTEVIGQKYVTTTPGQPDLHHNDLSLLLRLGLEKEKEICHRWEVLYGFDLLYSYDLKNNEQGDNIIGVSSNRQKEEGAGFSGIFGIKFQIAPRLFISTETDFEFWTYRGLVTSVNSLSSGSNKSNSTNGVYTNYSIPQNIYLDIEF